MKSSGKGSFSARLPSAWLWVAGAYLTWLSVAGGALDGWGYEPYRSTSLVAHLVVAVAGAGLAWLFWRRRGAAVRAYAFVSRPIRPVLLLPLVWVLFVVLRERRYIGDWINVAFALPMEPSWMLTDYILWRTPLTNLLQYLHWEVFLAPVAGRDLLFPWQVLLAAYGVLLVVGQWLAGRAALRSGRLGKLHVLLYCTSGLLYFSLGHVENYVVPMVFMSFTAWASVRAIRRGRGAAGAMAWYGAAAMAHPQCVVFAPSMLVVLAACLPPRRRIAYAIRCLAGLLCVPVLFVAGTFAAGIGIHWLAITGGDPGGTLLPYDQALSWARLRDLWMILVRVFPSLPAVFLAVVVWRRRLPASDRVGVWFALNVASGFCFCLFIWNKAPMPVDWDLMGPSLLMVWMGLLYGFLRAAPVRRRVQMALCVAALQVPLTLLWLGWTTAPDPQQTQEIERLEKSVETYWKDHAPSPMPPSPPPSQPVEPPTAPVGRAPEGGHSGSVASPV